MLAILLAAALAAAPAQDTVVIKDGTRVTGTIVEESPSTGVTIQLEDGTLRRFDPDAIARIERGGGARQASPAGPPQSQPPGPAATAPQEPRSAPPVVQGPLDTVFLVSGGRVRGRVIEEVSEGVTIQLPDGTTRRIPAEQIARIAYADGSVRVRREPYPRPPPPRRPPPPAGPPYAGPPPYAQPAQARPQRGLAPILPVYASFGLGGIGFGGDMGDGIDTGDVLEGQLDLWFEGGARITPAIGLGLYLDVGVGDAGNMYRDACSAAGLDCMSSTVKFGVLLRHTWGATSPVGKWLAVGTGFAAANVTTSNGDSHELVSYTGHEMLRLMGGVDLRSNPVFGVGLYGGVSWTTYTRIEEEGLGLPRRSIDDRGLQPLFEAGVRFTLFP
ncbi:hypothetical protein [Anaeromyxobacter sp. SG17]|uniref:hypothetical protein n=1 Tax=Anaeromyxobacter sp. SG17 TaxID=2925405 RepID=UPI001F55DF0B|nr:hypothetical protein [Anaeromyxobacter sp. SG17]